MRDLQTAIVHIARSIGMPITFEGAEQMARMYAAGHTAPHRTARQSRRGCKAGTSDD